MKDIITEYSNEFIEGLDEFVENEKMVANEKGLTDDERRAVHATAFKLLGRRANDFVEQAELE